jgi:PII-like signaling protein
MNPMQMHAKKRIEIILEAPSLRRLTDLLERLAVSGYTVLPVIAGNGRTGPWSEAGQVSEAERMVCVICIVDPAREAELIGPIFDLVKRQIGLINITEAQVIRGERF